MTDVSHLMSRRWLLGAMLAGVSAPALAREVAPDSSLRPAPRPGAGKLSASTAAAPPPVVQVATGTDLVAAAKLGGTVAYMVIDAASGRVLEQANPEARLPPASVAKTLTTLYALETLGGDYRFGTWLVATGPVSGGVLQGDLVLLGGGDPTLDTDALGDMAAALKAKGVSRVAGGFYVDGGALPRVTKIDPTQPDQVDYDPGLSGLNLNFNRVYFGWQRSGSGYQVTMDARGARYVPQVGMARMAIVDRGAPLYTHSDSGEVESWTVAQGALGRSGSRWLPVHETDLYTGDVFRALAAAQGIALAAPRRGRAPVGAGILVTHQSDPLRSILQKMLYYSTNVTAEIVGLTSSQKRGGPVADLAASAQRMTDWAAQRFGIRVKLIDHSGLGSVNRVSVTDLVTLLQAARDDDLRDILKEVHPLDAKGRPIRNSPVKIEAKSGTLNFVSNLAGYETTAAGSELIFAILTGDVARSEGVPKAQRERPPGVSWWTGRAHMLQHQLLARWATVYDNQARASR